MELVLMGLVALFAAGGGIVTLSWVVPAVSELYRAHKLRAGERLRRDETPRVADHARWPSASRADPLHDRALHL